MHQGWIYFNIRIEDIYQTVSSYKSDETYFIQVVGINLGSVPNYIVWAQLLSGHTPDSILEGFCAEVLNNDVPDYGFPQTRPNEPAGRQSPCVPGLEGSSQPSD